MWQYTYPNELYHYGIPGMKWGHRKQYTNTPKRQTLKKRQLTDGERKMLKSAGVAAVAAGQIYCLKKLNNSELMNKSVWTVSKVAKLGKKQGSRYRQAYMAETINKGMDVATKVLSGYLAGYAVGEIYKINK